MLPLPTTARRGLGTPGNKNKDLDWKLCAGTSQLTIGAPPERIVGSVCLSGSVRAGWNSPHPSLPEIQQTDVIKNNHGESEIKKKKSHIFGPSTYEEKLCVGRWETND